MRGRHKKWAAPYIQNHSEYITATPQNFKGKWSTQFKNSDNPIELEIGTGKGRFITKMAELNPNINFIGIEIQKSVIAMALRQVVEKKLDNVQFIFANGDQIEEYFTPHEISHLYLNFSDPWPKARHAKRRLTSPRFLQRYQSILKKSASIDFKTDNRNLFEYSVIELNNYKMIFEKLSLDLHDSEDNENNIMTEYEEKFSGKGPIYKIRARFSA